MLSANQLAVFFDFQYWKETSGILVIFHGVGIQAKAASEKAVVWLDVAKFAFHAIRLHDSLIINILRENQVVSWFFMDAVSHQGKVAFETTTFGCAWSDKLLVKLDYRVLWPKISLKRIIWFLSFFTELVISDQICAPGQIGLQDFLVINTPGRNQFIPLSFFFYLFLCIIYQTLQESIWLWLIN